MHSGNLVGSGTRMREQRRLEAVKLIRGGATQAEVGRQMCVSREAVRKWWDRYEAGGVRALRARPRTGPKRRLLLSSLRDRLPALLVRGASEFGFFSDLWTLSRVAIVIE